MLFSERLGFVIKNGPECYTDKSRLLTADPNSITVSWLKGLIFVKQEKKLKTVMSGRTKPVQNVKSVNARRRETWKVRERGKKRKDRTTLSEIVQNVTVKAER